MLEISGKETQISSLNKLKNLMIKFPCKTRLKKITEKGSEGQMNVDFGFKYSPFRGKPKEEEFNDPKLYNYSNIELRIRTIMSEKEILKTSIKIEYNYYSDLINVSEAPNLLFHANSLMRDLGFNFSKRITEARLCRKYDYSHAQEIKNIIENNNETEYMRLSRREAMLFKKSTERNVDFLSFEIELSKKDQTLLFDLLAKGFSINLNISEFIFNLDKDLPIFLHFVKTRSFDEIKPFIQIENKEITQEARDLFELQFGN